MSDRIQVRRKPERASYERTDLDAILDEARWCHVGLVRDGLPVVLPTIHARMGDAVYLHGAPATGFVRQAGQPICVSVTIVDALVLARSSRNHSMGYRSAVVFGTTTTVEGDEKLAALEAITEHVAPGRWATTRPPTAKELQGTAVLAVPLEEFSVKRRGGLPGDEHDGDDFPAWIGTVPVTTVYGAPVAAPWSTPGAEPPRWP
jgi:nitroimidazol reductase NimA-like FMN-containing flavoprotein (pyridoxamine 5'-phosphate oxidase superfamily)